MMRNLAVCLVLVAVAATARADSWHVDDDNCPGPGSGGAGDPFCSIQDAIDTAATSGDEIEVHPGTYVERIDLLGKAITLRSTDGPAVTIIDGNAGGSVITCANSEGPDTVIEGFTVTNGQAINGGGMYVSGADPVVIDCTFLQNRAGAPIPTTDARGGGMYLSDSDATVINCAFLGNGAEVTTPTPTVTAWGGGIHIAGGNPTMMNCTFSGNAVSASTAALSDYTAFAFGGAIAIEDGNPTVAHCTLCGNTASAIPTFALAWGAGVCSPSAGTVSVTNSVFLDNTTGFPDPDVFGAVSVSYSCTSPYAIAGTGNIQADPLLADPDGPDGAYGTADDDVHLLAGSPCIDAGDNGAVPADDVDLDGDGDTAEVLPLDVDWHPRFLDDPTTADSGAGTPPLVDMGVDEVGGPDCNGNSLPDDWDIDQGLSDDCNTNRVPDECEPGGLEDCNTNGVPDLCDIHAGTSQDCNTNAVPDACDIADGTSPDCNTNGIPDECDFGIPLELGENLLLNPGAETGDTTGWIGTPSYTVRSSNPDPHDGSFYFFPGAGPAHSLEQTIDLSLAGFEAATLDSGLLVARVGGYQHAYWHAADQGRITVEFLDDQDGVLDTFVGPLLAVTEWTLVDSQQHLPPGTRFVRYLFTATRQNGTNNDAYLDDAFVILGEPASQDCDTNGIPDECELEGRPFPSALSENTTGGDDSRFIGPPDDLYYGMGGQRVTYEFDDGFVVNDPGPDFNVYEVDHGSVEFHKIDVLVSGNGVDFVSVKSSEGPVVRIAGDEVHDNDAFARSYDLNDAGFFGVRYIRIDGDGDGGGGSSTAFDLDAIGAINLVGRDCNEDGVPDDCSIHDGTSNDCNGNAIPDDCEPGGLEDCNTNGVFDLCDISDGTSNDCNGNAVPDECDLDGGTSDDCNGNSIPDECEPDCNTNGVPDDCDISDGTSDDCNENEVPDECDISDGTSADCHDNAVPDECEISDGTSIDCNENAVPDECEMEGCPFPIALSENTTGGGDARFIGPPDDVYYGIGDQFVTYEFDCGFVVNGPGPDFNVYEADQGDAEFDGIEVLVSGNGVDFVSVTRSEGPVVRISGDEAHGDDAFARSYDLSVVGLFGVRYIRIDGWSADFDLDAIGAINFVAPDCNGNDVPDDCDLADGASLDCNGNAIPDDCEPDCNENAAADECDISDGTSTDCNQNAVPDECDIADGTSDDCNLNSIPDECELDCNSNGVPDDCDILDGTSNDCNANAVPDDCEPGGIEDCNTNGVFDLCDIFDGASDDCNDNAVPDECEPDCNASGVPDDCDVSDGTSADCNGNLIPDECEPGGLEDCNTNDVFDLCDIYDGTSSDCNESAVPDECEPDCNSNGVPDECDLSDFASRDCNGNAIPDECDISGGTSDDIDGNGIPDECNFAITRYTIDGGGVMFSVGGDFTLSGSVGQPDAGTMTGDDFQLTGGFWFEEPPGDCNGTGGTDLLDYAGLVECFAGPDDGSMGADCGCYDMDHDEDVDLSDFAAFQTAFMGG